MKNFTEQQMDYIKQKYGFLVDETINQRIDNDLIYYSDIEEHVNRFSNIVEVLRGEYTMENLWEDLYSEYYNENFEEIAEEVYDELDEEDQQLVDELAE